MTTALTKIQLIGTKNTIREKAVKCQKVGVSHHNDHITKAHPDGVVFHTDTDMYELDLCFCLRHRAAVA